MPPSLFPGEGFSYITWPFDWKYCLKSFIRRTVRSNVASSTQRFMSNCSAPNISGTSVSTALPPSAITRSDSAPTTGLAVMPEYPSEPPHFRPITSLPASTGVRRACAACSISSPSSSMPRGVLVRLILTVHKADVLLIGIAQSALAISLRPVGLASESNDQYAAGVGMAHQRQQSLARAHQVVAHLRTAIRMRICRDAVDTGSQ